MNRFTKYAWMVLVVLATGCSKGDGGDEGPVPGGVPGAGEAVPGGMVSTTLALSSAGALTATGPASKASSRAVGPDETAVGDMWMLQFDTEASAEGSLVQRAYVPAQDIEQIGSKLTAPVMLRESARSVIVVVANAPESFTAATLPDGSKLTELRARTFGVSATAGTGLPTDASARLPMYGETGQMAVSAVGSSSVPVDLVRLASRMNLTLVNEFTDGYPLLELTGVTLRNAPTKIAYGPLIESTTYLGDVFPEASDDNFRDYDPVTTDIAGTETNYMWYIAPNKRGTGSATDPADKSGMTAPDGQGNYCTHVSIRGRVTLNSGAAPREVTYNVYLGCNNTNDYNLWANAAYSARLKITGFNDGQMEVGYEGFGVTVGALAGLSDNTITGWHPDTGLEYVPTFLSFAPGKIDFGTEESPAAQRVTFSVNSGWRFSYTSGDASKVVASSSVAAGTDQTGGAQGENAECEVTFSPVIYKAQSGTPAAGTQYNATATFSTVGGVITDTRATVLLRTVPTFYGEPSVSPSPGSIPRAGTKVTATLSSNARWTLSVTPGGTATQVADVYASRSLEVSIPSNETWSTRTVKAVVQYGEQSKEWSYTQPGMSIDGITISPDPAEGIPGVGATYTVGITGDCGMVAVRAVCNGEELVRGYGSSGKPAEVAVPVNGSHANRDIIFQYQENGVWKNFSKGTQVPGYAVTASTVSPAGDIPGAGGRYTVSLSGLLPSEGVEIRAVSGSTTLATGQVSSNGRGLLSVPSNDGTLNRPVTFQYLWNGTWTNIESRSQLPNPRITNATVSPAGDIPYGGSVYTVTLSGVLPAGGVQVRALTNSVLATDVVSQSGSVAKLLIPANSGASARTVTFQYQLNGSWITIEMRNQLPTPQVTRAAVSPSGDIGGPGGGYQVALWGAMPSGGVLVRAFGNGVNVTGTVPASSAPVTLNIPANLTGNARSLQFQYQWNGNWVNIESRTQRPLQVGDEYSGGIVFWVSGTEFRIVSKKASPTRMKWANNANWSFYTTYLPNAVSGKEIADRVRTSSVNRQQGESGNFANDYPAFNYCYNLTDGGVSRGTWYVPTEKEHRMVAFGELILVNNRLLQIGGERLREMWLSTENGKGKAQVAQWHGYYPHSTTESWGVRCVRRQP